MSPAGERSGVAVAHDPAALRRQLAGWRSAKQRVALVPTMGALHDGHLALVRRGRAETERVVVSIFVNPMQFGSGEDLSAYPRTFAADCEKVAGLVDLIYAPSAEAMYPPGSCTFVTLEGPAAAGLEDRFRPTHFRGVATICTKLLVQGLPDIAVFGEKDFQQLKVLERLVTDLFLPTRIVASPTVRESDGLAMSSRNRFLSPGERRLAASLHQGLQRCAEAMRSGLAPETALAEARAELDQAGFALDYLEARRSDTLSPLGDSLERPARLLVAARLGTTRLIDNVEV